jgi:hypothetical protein
MNCRSSESLAVSGWWDFSPKVILIRPSVDRDNLLRRPGMPSASTSLPSEIVSWWCPEEL